MKAWPCNALPDSYLTTPINEREGALCIRYPINWTLEVCIYSVLWISNDRSQMKMNSLSSLGKTNFGPPLLFVDK